jgi:hypothetical protein
MLTETAYAVPLSSGITVFVQPLTIYEIRLMQAQVKTVYPDPSPKDYKSLVAGTTDIYDWNKEQQEAFAKAELTASRNRQRWIEDYMCIRGIVGAEIDGSECQQAALVEYFADDLQIARERLGDKLPADDWEAVLALFLIRSQQDRADIEKYAITPALKPLASSEVEAVMRSFRRDVWRRKRGQHPDEQSARGIPRPTADTEDGMGRDVRRDGRANRGWFRWLAFSALCTALASVLAACG